MGIYDKHMSDLTTAHTGLAKAAVTPKDKATLEQKVKAVEASFKAAVAKARAQKKLNDQANALKKKYDDYIAKMPDQGAFIKLVQGLSDAADAATDLSAKLQDEATKKKDKASAALLDKLTTALTAVGKDTASYVVFVGTADD